MARAQITNNATTTLAGALTNVATTFSVASGGGGKFPSSGYFYVTLLDSSNIPEIVQVTSRATDTFTVVRGQDGTTGRAFVTGAVVSLNPIAAIFAELVSTGDSLADPAFITSLAGAKVTGTVANATNATTSTTQAVDTNTTAIATTAFVIAQSAAATPLVESGSGAVGTSTRFARADHVHPLSLSTSLIATTTFTASGTWTKNAATRYAIYEVIGGGGNGAAAVIVCCGYAAGGGGAGGMTRIFVDLVPPSSASVTVASSGGSSTIVGSQTITAVGGGTGSGQSGGVPLAGGSGGVSIRGGAGASTNGFGAGSGGGGGGAVGNTGGNVSVGTTGGVGATGDISGSAGGNGANYSLGAVAGAATFGGGGGGAASVNPSGWTVGGPGRVRVWEYA